MRTILYILQKEFRQIFRNRAMLPIIFAVPIVQLLIIVNAATFEMKSIRLMVMDNDHSSYSRALVSHFRGSPFFRLKTPAPSFREAQEAMDRGEVDAILNVSRGFEKDLVRQEAGKLQLVVNAINGTAGGLTYVYTQSVIALYNQEIASIEGPPASSVPPPAIDVKASFWYNPELDYSAFMVAGILVILVTVISLILSSMNIVREKEIGTIEQINVTPVRKYQFITGKLLPFLIIALFELAFGLLVGKLVFDTPIVGSIGLIFLVATVYCTVILAMGLLVSTLSDTQQQAMFVSFFFMLVFILMSGLFTAVENMPGWAREFNRFNPVAYFIRIMRMILLKGSGLADFRNEFLSLMALGAILLSLSVWRYKKTS